MAHKLDALDGVLDGTPPLPRAWQREWARDFQAAFDAFAAEVHRGRDTAIDPYAAEAPEEFFAVCSEYHFSDPRLLQATLPTLAAHLARLYGAPPLASVGATQPWTIPHSPSRTAGLQTPEIGKTSVKTKG